MEARPITRCDRLYSARADPMRQSASVGERADARHLLGRALSVGLVGQAGRGEERENGIGRDDARAKNSRQFP
jgi:7-keto-8-aminopelargonate synthetase-like enzyme